MIAEEQWRYRAVAVTKYNPIHYNNNIYTKNEWTSYSDIGREYDAHLFTKEEYERVERSYIDAVNLFIDFVETNSIQVCNYPRKYAYLSECRTKDPQLYDVCKRLKDGMILKTNEISIVIQLVLREYVQLSLVVDELSNSYIHFGYDYYMYFVSDRQIGDLKVAVEKLGLFFHD
jgi:hypothetical protein